MLFASPVKLFTDSSCSIVGLDSQAALSICELLRQIAKTGLAILCVVNQPSARLLQAFDRLLLLSKEGKQLYFGKVGSSCKTVVNYLEKNGARPRDADENSAEWMLHATSSTESNSDSQDWAEIWKKSPECKTTKAKLAQLKKKFSERADLLDASATANQSTPAFDAAALQRKSAILP